jgi:hypothetical protein
VLTINEQRNLLGFDQLTTEQQVQPKQEENANNTSK